MLKIAIILAITFSFTNVLFAQDSLANKIREKNKRMYFVDKNGDGYNDNAPDHDGDGIPNGLDPDWQKKKGKEKKQKRRFIDLDGDGINDYLQEGGLKEGVDGRRESLNQQSDDGKGSKKQKRKGKR